MSHLEKNVASANAVLLLWVREVGLNSFRKGRERFLEAFKQKEVEPAPRPCHGASPTWEFACHGACHSPRRSEEHEPRVQAQALIDRQPDPSDQSGTRHSLRSRASGSQTGTRPVRTDSLAAPAASRGARAADVGQPGAFDATDARAAQADRRAGERPARDARFRGSRRPARHHLFDP